MRRLVNVRGFQVYRIKEIKIKGFWDRGEVSCVFNNDVNIIIGRNGTGKTTLMNILQSALTCDLNGLAESSFEKIFILLELNDSIKEVTVCRSKSKERSERRYEDISYIIDGVDYQVSLILPIERRHSPLLRRRAEEEAGEVRAVLEALLKISSISVYRLRHDEDYEVRDKFGVRITAPVDYRAEEALSELSLYIAEIGVEEQRISKELQKNVLASILYSSEDQAQSTMTLKFDKTQEEADLIDAYRQLKAMDNDISKKIKTHVQMISNTIQEINSENEGVDSRPLEAFRKTRKVIELSLEANEKVSQVKKQINLFIEKLKEFMPEKDFLIESGRLIVRNDYGEIEVKKLSSGEKQLIILLIEALLQRRQDYLLLADEPEISLHIEWQGKIIPAVRELNPNAQIIVATHSPEIAAPYKEKIFNMTEIYSE